MTTGSKSLIPRTPARDAASRIIRKRLNKTAALLSRVASTPMIPESDVHKLRVSTRRADAAIRAFSGLTRGKGRKRVRRVLRSVRRNAGAARECDVHMIMLQSDFTADTPEVGAAIGFLSAGLEREAEVARDRLRLHAGSVDIDWLRTAHSGLIRRRDCGGTYADVADLALRSASHRVLRVSSSDLRDFESLHALRIACKRLRYSVEIFRPCLADEQATSALQALTEIQERLGYLNDLQDLQRRVEKETAKRRARALPRIVLTGFAWMRADLHERQNMQRAQFLRWWAGALETVQDSVRRASEGVRVDSRAVTNGASSG